MFKTPIAIDASRSGAGTSQQHNRQQQHRRMAPPNQSLIRATDTNRTMALQILQVYIICTRRAVMCSRAEWNWLFQWRKIMIFLILCWIRQKIEQTRRMAIVDEINERSQENAIETQSISNSNSPNQAATETNADDASDAAVIISPPSGFHWVHIFFFSTPRPHLVHPWLQKLSSIRFKFNQYVEWINRFCCYKEWK